MLAVGSSNRQRGAQGAAQLPTIVAFVPTNVTDANAFESWFCPLLNEVPHAITLLESRSTYSWHLPACLASAAANQVTSITLNGPFIIDDFSALPRAWISLQLTSVIFAPNVTRPLSGFHPNGSVNWDQLLSRNTIQTVKISFTNLVGSLPTALPSYLSTFDLESCPQITGTIPSTIFSNFASIPSFAFAASNCGLNGTIPNLLFLPLRGRVLNSFLFRIRGNDLSGSISPTLLSNLKVDHYFYLDLADNHLSGTIPDFFLPELGLSSGQIFILVDLTSNHLEGSIPPHMLGPIANVSYFELSLSHNRLNGSLPERLFPSSFHVIPTMNGALKLRLDDNSLSSTIPPAFLYSATMSGAIEIFNHILVDLSNNQLNGGIPASLLRSSASGFMASTTVSLNFAHNSLTGSIASDIFANVFTPLASELLLDVSFNRLSGTLPTSLIDGFPTNATDLKIRAAQNKISGRDRKSVV